MCIRDRPTPSRPVLPAAGVALGNPDRASESAGRAIALGNLGRGAGGGSMTSPGAFSWRRPICHAGRHARGCSRG
eukprot:11982277-Alexandrium_andersonii.AAC.1